MKLVLVRHGESAGNAGERFGGEEPHLTDRGLRQAARAAERACEQAYDALYSSPMSRALGTACAIAAATGLSPSIEIDLCEHRQLPEFRGCGRAELLARYPSVTLPEACTERGWWGRGMEEEEALYERAAQVARRLRARHEATGDRVLVVTHGGFASALISTLLDVPPCGYMRFWHDNCAFSELYLQPGLVRLEQLNCTRHIPEEERS